MAFAQLFTIFSGLWPPYVAPEPKRPAGRTSSDHGSTNSVDSKKGRRVESHSKVPSEREVMFDKFTWFEVLSNDRIEGTGQWLIYMREL